MEVKTQAVVLEEEEARLQVLKDIQMDSEVEEVIATPEEVVHLLTSPELGLIPVTPLPAVQVRLEWEWVNATVLGATRVEEEMAEQDLMVQEDEELVLLLGVMAGLKHHKPSRDKVQQLGDLIISS